MPEQRLIIFCSEHREYEAMSQALAGEKFENFVVELRAKLPEKGEPQEPAGRIGKEILWLGAGLAYALDSKLKIWDCVCSNSVLTSQDGEKNITDITCKKGLAEELIKRLTSKGFLPGALTGTTEKSLEKGSLGCRAAMAGALAVALAAEEGGVPWLNLALIAGLTEGVEAGELRSAAAEKLALKVLVLLSTFDRFASFSDCAGCSGCGVSVFNRH